MECLVLEIPAFSWVIIEWEFWVEERRFDGGGISDITSIEEVFGEGRGSADTWELSNSKAQDLHCGDSDVCCEDWESAEELKPDKEEFDTQGSWKKMKSERAEEGCILEDKNGNTVSLNRAYMVTKTRCDIGSKHWNPL